MPPSFSSFPDERSQWRRGLGFLILAVLAGALVRLLLFNGLLGHDDWVYLFYIRSHLNGDNSELLQVLWGLRWGVWGPVALLFKTFGVHYWLTFLPGFLLGLACIPLAYFSALRISGRISTARWAAVAMILNPIDWFVSSTLRGDIETSFWAGVVVLGIVYIEQNAFQKKATPVLVPLAVGLAWGLGALTKEWAFVFAWGFLGVTVTRFLIDRKIPWEYGFVLLGLGLVLTVDGLVLQHLTGNFGQRFAKSVSWYEEAWANGGYDGDITQDYSYLPSVLFNFRNDYTAYNRFLNGYPYVGYYYYFLALALAWIAWACRRQNRTGLMVAAFLGGMLLWTEFGSMSFRHYLPYHKEPRYLTILSVGAAVCLGLALDHGWARAGRYGRTVLVVALAALSAHTFWLLRQEHTIYVTGQRCVPELFTWLEKNPTVNLWLNGTLQQEMDLRFGYRFAAPVHNHRGQAGYGALQDYVFLEKASPGDYVLMVEGCEISIGNLYRPERWEKVTVFGKDPKAVLYRIEPPSHPTLMDGIPAPGAVEAKSAD